MLTARRSSRGVTGRLRLNFPVGLGAVHLARHLEPGADRDERDQTRIAVCTAHEVAVRRMSGSM